jgi:hypothetical protein
MYRQEVKLLRIFLLLTIPREIGISKLLGYLMEQRMEAILSSTILSHHLSQSKRIALEISLLPSSRNGLIKLRQS